MQAIMCAEDGGVLDPTSLIPVQVDGHTAAFRSVTSLSLVDLGKKLLLSAKEGDTDQVRALMSKGAPFTTDWLGTSPLHLAAQHGHVTTAEVLLRAGISRDARTKVERTPLHIAAQEGNTAIVQLLLNAGAEVDSRDMLKMTPLHWAIEREHLETVQLLLEHGANPQRTNKFNKSAFCIALDSNRHDILQLLQNAHSLQSASTGRTTHQSQELAEATQSLALELAHAPPASHQEEVETTAPRTHPTSFQTQKGNKFTYRPTASWGTEVTCEADGVEQDSPSSDKAATDSSGQDVVAGQKTLQLLQAHGITMLPTDDSTLVASAVESGHTVVLTEAGKLALNLTRSNLHKVSDGSIARSTATTGVAPGKKKVITIRAGQLLSMGGGTKGPNILKRVSARDTDMFTHVPAKVLVKSTPGCIKIDTSEPSKTDLVEITKQLEEARREAEAYKELLSKKEREAELYKRQIQSLSQAK